jgi:UDP-2,3-diacylglucosamine hydrolase
MFRYLQSELNVVVFKKPIELRINESSFYVGHGDGLGPGDSVYKILKKIFTNSFAQWIFKWIHPDIGMAFAKRWSRSSRIKKFENYDRFLGEKEFLTQYCKRKESEDHRDFYIFGHRHLALEIDINEKTKYYNLGEWVHEFSYGVFDGDSFQLIKFEEKS